MRLIIVACLVALITASASGQGPIPSSPVDGNTIDPKWAVTQGGFFLLILAILWSYRRDFFRAVEGQQEQLKKEREERDYERTEMKTVLRDVASSTATHSLLISRNTDAITTNTQSNRDVVTEMRKLAERSRGERE